MYSPQVNNIWLSMICVIKFSDDVLKITFKNIYSPVW